LQMYYGGKKKSDRTLRREAFFLEFAEAIRSHLPNTLLMVTGGFRTRKGIKEALASGSCELVGLARPAVLKPTAPRDVLLNQDVVDDDAELHVDYVDTPWVWKKLGVNVVGGGTVTVS
jgi:2,4-dienoyl-CoA reductase-like NADH-dependent reductase (Old Yellow Enzyme family)